MPVLPGIPVPGPDSGCGGGGGVGGSGGSWLACWPRWILSAAGGGAAGSTAPANGVGWPASGGSCAGCDLNGGEERGPYRANRSGGGSPYTPTRARPLLIRAPSSPQRGRKISRVKKRWPVRFREGYPLLKKHPPGVLCAISGGAGWIRLAYPVGWLAPAPSHPAGAASDTIAARPASGGACRLDGWGREGRTGAIVSAVEVLAVRPGILVPGLILGVEAVEVGGWLRVGLRRISKGTKPHARARIMRRALCEGKAPKNAEFCTHACGPGGVVLRPYPCRD